MANHCDFYEYKSGFLTGKHWCCLKDKEISTDTYREFCEYISSAKKCPFRREHNTSDCFISTACAKAKNLPDDCYELETLRKFRDNYMKKMPNGEQKVKEYYDIAPKIVKAVEKNLESDCIFEELFKELVHPCVNYIEQGQNGQAYILYEKTVLMLKDKYLK